jgi:ribosome recycling factor
MSTAFDINDTKRRMEGAINAFKHDLAGLRTGRASVNLLDPIMVDAYGASTPLNQVANVTVPEARMLWPWA